MAIKKFRFRPEGVNDYSDILHPETSADIVLMNDSNVADILNNHLATDATTATKGHVQLSDSISSNSTTVAATANAVRQVKEYAVNAVNAGSSSDDPNTTIFPYILTKHPNDPDGGNGVYWHIRTYFYSSKTGNRAQIAVSYNGSTPRVCVRHYYQGWTAWAELHKGSLHYQLVDGVIFDLGSVEWDLRPAYNNTAYSYGQKIFEIYIPNPLAVIAKTWARGDYSIPTSTGPFDLAGYTKFQETAVYLSSITFQVAIRQANVFRDTTVYLVGQRAGGSEQVLRSVFLSRDSTAYQTVSYTSGFGSLTSYSTHPTIIRIYGNNNSADDQTYLKIKNLKIYGTIRGKVV